MMNSWIGILIQHQIKHTGCLAFCRWYLELQFYPGSCKHKGAFPMTLTKVEIVESIHNQIGLPKNKSTEIVETLLEIITSSPDASVLLMISSNVSTASMDFILVNPFLCLISSMT
jgi:hypothetical protein